MVDFSPILTLLMALIPIILIIAILGRFLKGKVFVFPLLGMLGLGMFAAPMLNFSVAAAASLEPSTGTLMTDIPQFFTASGLTASTAHSVNVTVAGVETVAIAAVTSNTDGEISFSLTFTTEGSTQVEVITGGAAKCSGNFNVIDLIEMLMPYIILFITLGVVFGLAGMLTRVVKR